MTSAQVVETSVTNNSFFQNYAHPDDHTEYELHFNLPNHSTQHMAVCGVSLHQGSTESRKSLEQKFIFQIGTLNPHGINERFSFN